MDRELAATTFYQECWPHLPAVLRSARILTGNDEHAAEDLAQETMLKAFAAIDQLRARSDAKAWLLAILRNARVDRIRRASRENGTVSLEAMVEEPPASEAEEALEDQKIRRDPDAVLNWFSDQQVIDALKQLPEEIRWTLLLVDVHQMDQAEAAGILAVPVGTIKSRAHRGRRMLRRELMTSGRQRRLADRPPAGAER